MTRSELIERICARCCEEHHVHPNAHLKPRDVERGVKAILEHVSYSLSSGQRIEIRGFGSFFLQRLNARKGRNPKTGSPVDLPDRHVPRFRPGKALRNGVNSANER